MQYCLMAITDRLTTPLFDPEQFMSTPFVLSTSKNNFGLFWKIPYSLSLSNSKELNSVIEVLFSQCPILSEHLSVR